MHQLSPTPRERSRITTVLTVGLVIAQALFTCTANGQYYIPLKEHAEALKSKTLAVELLDGTWDAITRQNTALRKVFTEHWKLNPVEFKTSGEIARIIQDHDARYVVLGQTPGSFRMDHSIYTPQAPDRFGSGYGLHFHSMDFRISHPYEAMPGKQGAEARPYFLVVKLNGLTSEMEEIDYLFVVQQFQLLHAAALQGTSMAAYYDPAARMNTLKTRTLVLAHEQFEKLKDTTAVGRNWSGRHRIVDKAELDRLILAQDPDVAYIKAIYSPQHRRYACIAVDARTGEVLSISLLKKGRSFNDGTTVMAGTRPEGIPPQDIRLELSALEELQDLKLQEKTNQYTNANNNVLTQDP